ncbi:MAG TPA: glycosyltransferase, partial [Chthonomonadales bacterium]|nr:glycosyltransferase [Chthonomonadales bacterium]
LGSSIAIPKPVLATVGGMESLADYLADDFQLGFRTRAAGYRVVLSTHVVEDVIGKESFRSTWSRRLRWARTIRCCRPAGYLGSVTTHGIALGLVFLCLTRFAPGGWYTLAAVTILRLCAAALLAGITGDRHVKRRILLLPLSDLLSAAIFVASYLGSAIVWRGAVYRLKPDGTLAPVPGRPQSPSA